MEDIEMYDEGILPSEPPEEPSYSMTLDRIERRLERIERAVEEVKQELKRLQPVVLVNTTTTVPPTISFGTPTVTWKPLKDDK
jgi:hypothetical protein